MQFAITLVAPPGRSLQPAVVDRVGDAAGTAGGPVWLAPGCACDLLTTDERDSAGERLRAAVAGALSGAPVDWAVQPAAGRRKRLLLCDMDSTIVGQECIDEVASLVGHGPAVAGVTARAMAGEINFETALRERVAMLEGTPVNMLERVYTERVTVNPGARVLVATMRAAGASTLLVSGGFTFFTERVAADVGFDAHQANRLLSEVGRLAGLVAEPIFGRDGKRQALLAACERLGITPSDAVAIGDGANDLSLIEEAGLGIAYRAKPVLTARADARIDHGDLTAALFFQGYTGDAFEER